MPAPITAIGATLQYARTPGVYEHDNKPYVTFAELAKNRFAMNGYPNIAHLLGTEGAAND